MTENNALAEKERREDFVEKLDKALREAEEKERQEALRPDKDKLIDWIRGYGTNPIPDLNPEELDDILKVGLERIQETLNWMLRQIDNL